MAILRLSEVQKDTWYNISLYADLCKKHGRTIEKFEAKYNGYCWTDIAGVEYSCYAVIFIDDELAF